MRERFVCLSNHASNGSSISAYGMYKIPLTVWTGSHFGGFVASAIEINSNDNIVWHQN